MQDRYPPSIFDSVAIIPLRPHPGVVARFLAREAEGTAFKDLAVLVASDPAFAAHVLTIATSPPYRRETNPFSLEQSLAALGRPLLRTIASCLAVRDNWTDAAAGPDFAPFWRHSLRVAALAGALAKTAGYDNDEEAYLSGLLHDIGYLLLAGSLAPTATETDLLGAELVESWQLASFMAAAVRFHRFPEEQVRSAGPLLRILWAAHVLSENDPPLPGGKDLGRIAALLGVENAAVANALECALVRAGELAAVVESDGGIGGRFHGDSRRLPELVSGENLRRGLLEEMMGIQAAMQPLQLSLVDDGNEAGLVAALSVSAQLLFGLQRPLFLSLRDDRPMLTPVGSAGYPPLLSRLEIPLDPAASLVAASLQAQRPCSSYDPGRGAPLLLDLQLARLLGSEGLLSIPLGKREQRIGVMVFGLSDSQYAASAADLDRLSSFGFSAAGTLAALRSVQRRDQQPTAELGGRFEQKARRIIHEATNPLGIINSYLDICTGKVADGADVREELAILKDEIARVERIIRSLGDQPKRALPRESVDLNVLIQGMLTLYGESLFEVRKIGIDSRLAPDLPPVRGDRDSLKQILLNLWKNSAEAMPDGGSIFISTAVAPAEGAAGYAELRLGDTGPGLPDDVRGRLFQALTPDRRQDHAGVGLSIVANLVMKLGGKIACSSTPQGTIFTIRLPLEYGRP